MALNSCPGCGAERVGGERFCPSCGLDYWRAAAGTTAPAAAEAGAAPVAVAAPQRSGASGLLVAVGLLLLAATGVGAAVMILNGSEPPDLRAGAPPPTYSAEREVVNAFFREARDPDAAFAVAMDGTIGVEEPAEVEMAVDGSIEIHGTDWMMEMRISGIPGQDPVRMRAAMIDNVGYAALPGVHNWRANQEVGPMAPVNPFMSISTVSEIEYLGRETSGATTLHHLLVTKWVGGNDFATTLAGVKVTDKENTFHIWVTAEGVPTRADYEARFTGELQDQDFTMGADVVYTFSRWGEVGPIQPPV